MSRVSAAVNCRPLKKGSSVDSDFFTCEPPQDSPHYPAKIQNTATKYFGGLRQSLIPVVAIYPCVSAAAGRTQFDVQLEGKFEPLNAVLTEYRFR